MNASSLLFRAALALAVLAVTPPVFAETAGDRAVALGSEGLDLLAASQWEAAYDRFAQAEATTHSNVFVLYMARAKRGGGALVLARELYERVVREALPADAPEPWKLAREQASAELRELDTRIPRLRIAVRGARLETLRVAVDGVPVEIREPLRLDPGQRELTASDDRGRTVRALVTLAARGELREFELVFPASNVSPLPAPSAQTSRENAAGKSLTGASRTPAWPGYVAFGVGAAGVIAGATTGLIALDKANELEQACGGTQCTPNEQGRADSAGTFATVSTVSFIVGGVGLATGLTWFLLRPGPGANVGVTLAPTRIVAHGHF